MKKINIYESAKKKNLILSKEGITALVGAIIILVTATGCSNNKSQENPETTVEITETATPEATVLNADNFAEKAEELSDNLKAKGLEVKSDLVNGALFVINLEDFTKDDFEKLCDEDFDIVEETEKTLRLASMITTHNNKATQDNQIDYAQFSYNAFDKEMLSCLDNVSKELVTSLRTNTNCEDTVNNALTVVEPFITSDGTLKLASGNYSKRNLTPGADLWSEFISIQMANEVNMYDNLCINKHVEQLVQTDTQETAELGQLRNNLEAVLSSNERLTSYYRTFQNAKDKNETTELLARSLGREILIQNIQDNCIGATALPHIINFDVNCIEADKVLTKSE